MTLLGKIFTVLIIIMSLVYSALAVMVFVTHKDWKNAAVEAASALDAAKLANLNLEREKQEALNQLAAERAARAAMISELASKNQQLDDKAANAAKQVVELSAQLQIAEAQAALANQQKSDLTEETKRLREAKVKAEQAHDEQLAQAVALNDKLEEERGASAKLKERNNALAQLSIQQKLVMDSHGLTIDSISKEPPPVDGVITKVSASHPLVEISLGSDDGLKAGHRLEVFRGNSYLGRIVIRETSPNRAVGLIVKELQRQPFQEGDRVATKLG